MKAHYLEAAKRARWNASLTLLVVIASTAVGSTLFTQLSSHSWGYWPIAGLSLSAALLAGLQSASQLGETSERHRRAGAEWDKLFNLIAATLAVQERFTDTQNDERITRCRRWIEDLVRESPVIPERTFRKVCLEDSYDSILPSAVTPCDVRRWRGARSLARRLFRGDANQQR